MVMDDSFAARLCVWQKRAGRHHLPWQGQNAYCVWLSEIMLQQTQVATVLRYYPSFLARFPDVFALAQADEQDVLAHWSGLGYYARARHLHRCARQVAAMGGEFPHTVEALSALPGIGRSTAAAIAVFAFGARSAILDGNVKRILCRHEGIFGDVQQGAVARQLWACAEKLLPQRDLPCYTQGLMDLGSTLCGRKQAKCGECPVNEDCYAHRQGCVDALPSARKRPLRGERRLRWLLLFDGSHLLLQQRPTPGVWGGLWTPPDALENAALVAPLLQKLHSLGMQARPMADLHHDLTHLHLQIEVLLYSFSDNQASCCREQWPADWEGNSRWLTLEECRQAPIPTPCRQVVETLLTDRANWCAP